MGQHRIVMARSGVQYYTANELQGLGLYDVPKQHAGLAVFGVYRPAEVLRKALPKLKGTPVVPSHDYFVQTGKEPFIIGKCGTKPQLKIIDGEAMVLSDMNIPDESKAPKYSELSLGYSGSNKWSDGITRDGEPYQIICDGITHVEHLAYVPRARGGKHVRILDSASEKLNSLLYRVVHKVNDGDTSWNVLMHELRNVDRYSQADIERFANGLVMQVQGFEPSDDKELLLRYLADLPVLWDDDDPSWQTALDVVEKLYNSIRGANMPTEDDKPQEAPNQDSSPIAGIDAALKLALAQTLTQAVAKACGELLGVDSAQLQPQTAQAQPEQQNGELPDEKQPSNEAEDKQNGDKPNENPQKDDNNEEQKPTEQTDKPSAQGVEGETTAQPAEQKDGVSEEVTSEKTADGSDSIVVTKEQVISENNSAENTEVPEAAVATAKEEVMTESGVVPTDNGQLRNQVEEPVVSETAEEVCPKCGKTPCECIKETPKETATPSIQVNINTPPADAVVVHDAMPVFNSGVAINSSNSGSTDALTDVFLKMKRRM